MRTYYCKRCDKDDVLGAHRCFTFRVRNPVTPMDKRPDPNKTTSAKLMSKLQSMDDLPDLTNAKKPKRLYTGHWQRSSGAWSWVVQLTDQVGSVGSAWSMTQCLRSKNLCVVRNGFDYELIPE